MTGVQTCALPIFETDLAAALKRLQPDVMIDFTRPDVVYGNVLTALAHKVSPPVSPPLGTHSRQNCFPLIGFAVSFEMNYFNLLRILDMGKVRLLAEERGEKDPIVLAGGPCATFNPEPLSLFVDAFIIGEGEVIMPKLMDVYAEALKNQLSRIEILQLFSGGDCPGAGDGAENYAV